MTSIRLRHGDLALVWLTGERRSYNAGEFLSVHEYENVLRWTDQLGARPAVQRGRMVNSVYGKPENQLRERHNASDLKRRHRTSWSRKRLTRLRQEIAVSDCGFSAPLLASKAKPI